MTKFRTVSLFAGCGGLDLGLERAGFEILWANDMDKYAAEIYQYNLGNMVQGNICDIHEDSIPDCDILTAGFPCQPFSTAGARRSTEDERGNLFLECIRIIKSKQPKAVLFENVRGLLSAKNTDGSLVIDTIIQLLEELTPGYRVAYRLLAANQYGIPQKRHRVIIVGIRKDLDKEFIFPEPTHSLNDDSLTLRHTINVSENTPNQDEVWALSPQALSLIPYITEGGSWKDIPYEVLPERLKKIRDDMKKYRSPNFFRRFSRDEINGTITASAMPEKCGILHPLENRRFSVREVARIQSFPDDFIFVGDSIPNKYKVIGNAVPPLLGEVIGKQLIYILSS